MAESQPQRLPILDASFLGMETRDTPMHVGALQIFSLPDQAAPDFVKTIVQRYRTPAALGKPWNLKLAPVPLGRVLPATVVADDLDFHYHVRHSALPAPGGERELGELISHLHSQPLDRTRPLWTCHVIEGLHENRFAIYIKIHHALSDGIKGARMICASLRDKASAQLAPPWELQPVAPHAGKVNRSARTPASLAWLKSIPGACKPLFVRKPGAAAVLRPFEAPNSALLNGRVTGARRIATQQLELDRVRRIAKRAGASLNDVFLAVCSAALRRHLLASDALPDASLIAGVPMNLRGEGADDNGNAVGFIWASLASDIADPRQRLAAIRASIGAWKQHLQKLPAAARLPFTTLTFTPAVAVFVGGLGARVRPPMNVIISNVPGPERALYLGAARMEALYPISIPVQGLALNITCVSYAGKLNIGFTGSRDRLPHLQYLAVYASDALDELDAAI